MADAPKDDDTEKMDEVLRRMLATPPAPHAPPNKKAGDEKPSRD